MDDRAHTPRSPINRDWKDIYKAALFEDDNAKLPQRIADAEKALFARALELFGAEGDQIGEQKAMENATYFLRLLGNMGTGGAAGERVNRPTGPPGWRHPAAEILFLPNRGQDSRSILHCGE